MLMQMVCWLLSFNEYFDDIGLSSDRLLGKLVVFTADGGAVNLGNAED